MSKITTNNQVTFHTVTTEQSQTYPIDPVDQFVEINKKEDLLDDLDRLTKKYNMYNENGKKYDPNLDEYSKMIKVRDTIIEEMKTEIALLKQQMMDITFQYNEKIEMLRTEHRKELHRLHTEYVKRINKKTENN
jgi:DNA repair ATPase RecN